MDRTYPIVMLAFLLCTACVSANQVEDPSLYDGPVNECKSDNNCVDSTCHPELQICTSIPTENENLYAKVIPSQSADLPSQVFQVKMEPNNQLLLQMKTPVPVKGITPNMAGRVIFSDQNNILAGKDSNLTVYKSIPDNPVAFNLLPSVYNVSILPEGDDGINHPINYIYDVIVAEDGTFRNKDGVKIAIELPPDDFEYNEISGTVMNLSPDGETIGANGLQVLATQTSTGKIISTTATTNDGEFKLRIDPDVNNFQIAVSKPTEPFHPTVYRDIAWSDLPDPLIISIPLPTAPVILQAKVEVPGEGSLENPPPSCYFLFELAGENTERKLERWVITNESGEIEETSGTLGVHLYPDTYQVTVLPIASSANDSIDYSSEFIESIEITGTLSSDDDPEPIRLQKRHRIEGEITVQQSSIPMVSLQAEPLPGETVMVRDGRAVSNEQGTFSMWTDKGAYRITAEAPRQSRYAWGNTTWNIESDEEIGYSAELQIPFVISGMVVPPPTAEETTFNVEGTIIEWYRVWEDRASQIGRSIADQQGAFTALLPTH